jgi:hypothetical protein
VFEIRCGMSRSYKIYYALTHMHCVSWLIETDINEQLSTSIDINTSLSTVSHYYCLSVFYIYLLQSYLVYTTYLTTRSFCAYAAFLYMMYVCYTAQLDTCLLIPLTELLINLQ